MVRPKHDIKVQLLMKIWMNTKPRAMEGKNNLESIVVGESVLVKITS